MYSIRVRTLDGRDETVQADPSKTVLQFKEQLHNDNGFTQAPNIQRLIYLGRVLNNTEILSEITPSLNGNTIHLVTSPPPQSRNTQPRPPAQPNPRPNPLPAPIGFSNQPRPTRQVRPQQPRNVPMTQANHLHFPDSTTHTQFHQQGSPGRVFHDNMRPFSVSINQIRDLGQAPVVENTLPVNTPRQLLADDLEAFNNHLAQIRSIVSTHVNFLRHGGNGTNSTDRETSYYSRFYQHLPLVFTNLAFMATEVSGWTIDFNRTPRQLRYSVPQSSRPQNRNQRQQNRNAVQTDVLVHGGQSPTEVTRSAPAFNVRIGPTSYNVNVQTNVQPRVSININRAEPVANQNPTETVRPTVASDGSLSFTVGRGGTVNLGTLNGVPDQVGSQIVAALNENMRQLQMPVNVVSDYNRTQTTQQNGTSTTTTTTNGTTTTTRSSNNISDIGSLINNTLTSVMQSAPPPATSAATPNTSNTQNTSANNPQPAQNGDLMQNIMSQVSNVMNSAGGAQMINNFAQMMNPGSGGPSQNDITSMIGNAMNLFAQSTGGNSNSNLSNLGDPFASGPATNAEATNNRAAPPENSQVQQVQQMFNALNSAIRSGDTNASLGSLLTQIDGHNDEEDSNTLLNFMLKTLFSKMTIQDTASLMQSTSRSDDDIDRIIAPKIGACRGEIIDWIGDSENLGENAMRLPCADVKRVLAEKIGEVTVSQDDTFDDNIAIQVDNLIKKIVEQHKDELEDLYKEQRIRDGYSAVDSVEKVLSFAVTKLLKILCEDQLSEVDFGKQVYRNLKKLHVKFSSDRHIFSSVG